MTLRSALAAIASVIASFLIVWIACMRAGIDASPAILSAALAVTLTRDPEPLSRHAAARKLIALPLVALLAGAVGATFRFSMPLGGALFTACITLSIWLRRFGPRARAIGRIIALPFIAMLAVPVHPSGSPPAMALSVIGAGIAAVLCTAAARALVPAPAAHVPHRPPREASRKRLDPPARMALQMCAALALAFTVGALVLPAHWFWVVLTAFIVCSGAIARGDAVYKAILRLGGAAAGTLAAVLATPLEHAAGPLRASVVFLVLFAAMWLRERNYAYWAAGATLIFALLLGTGDSSPLPLFLERIEGIALGALCAIAATWFVFPVRTEQIVKRRMAEVAAARKRGDTHAEAYHLRELERARAPLVLAQRVREFARMPTKAAVVMERGIVVHISVAMTIDGYIDDRSERRLVLSNAEDFDDVRALRAQYDAVLVGAGTVRSDDPSLRVRDGQKRPMRVTVTRSGNLDPQAKFFDGSARTIVFAPPGVVAALRETVGEQTEVHELESTDPRALLGALHELGVRSLFVEGGTRILTAFLAAGTFDRLRLAIAPFFAGEGGGARIVDPAAFANDAGHRLRLVRARSIGDMAVLDYERRDA